jgi:prepilin-type N-terminal cleavage/methylation domain-containing protein
MKRNRKRPASARARQGFSLVETVVAMTMFAIVMLGMAKMAAAVAVRGRTNDLTARRNAVLQLEANKFGGVPFANLATWSTTTQTLTAGNFKYSRQLVITVVGRTRYTVKVVVVPTADPTKKDSVIIERSLPSTGSPLCVGC